MAIEVAVASSFNSEFRLVSMASFLQVIGLFVVDELVRRVVIIHLPPQMQTDIRRVTGEVRVARRVGIPFWLTACLDAVENIASVEGRRIAADFGNLSARESFGRCSEIHERRPIARLGKAAFVDHLILSRHRRETSELIALAIHRSSTIKLSR